VTWTVVQLRRLADARAATGGLFGLALVTSFLFAAAPRAIDAQADKAMQATVASAGADTRNIAVMETGRMSQGSPDPLAVVAATGDQLFEQFPRSVAALIQARYQVVDTPRFRSPSLEALTVRLRYLQGATDRVKLVSGRMPTGQTDQLPVPPGTLLGGSTQLYRSLPPPDTLTTFEVALSVASARDLRVGVGDKLQLVTDSTDKLAGVAVAYLAISVVGIYQVDDDSANYWFGDTSLEQPQIRSLSQLAQVDDVTALVSADAYPALLDATFASSLPLRYTWRYEVDGNRLRADAAGSLLTDLRRMESVFLASNSASTETPQLARQGLSVQSDTSAATLQNGLLHLIETYATGWRSVSQILSVAEVGSGAVALLALTLVCLLAGRRRAASLATWRSRGASRLHVAAGAFAEIAVELAVPVVLGAAVAVVVLPGRALQPTAIGAGAVLAFAAALVLGNALGNGSDPGTDGVGRGRGSGGASALGTLTRGAGARRIALEAVVVVVALVGAFVLRQRGVASAGSGTELASPDPFVAAVPVLIGVAAALVVARLLPLPLELLARLSERRRGLVALLALRRATRRANDRLLLTALLTMAAVWAFAAVSLAYLERASDASSWGSAGAPYRITLREGTLPPDLRLDKVHGVEAVADASVLAGHVPEKNEPLSVLALDLTAYRDVVRGGWLDGSIPESMIASETSNAAAPAAPARTAATAGTGAAPNAVPALISSAMARDAELQVGDRFDVALSNARPSFVVIAIRDTFATLAPGAEWVVVARGNLAARLPGGSIPPTQAFIRAGPDSAGAIGDALQARLPAQGYVVSRFDVLDGLRGTPDYVAVVFGLAAASFVAALYGALAIFAALLLVGAEESRESAHLRILGLSRGENFRLSAIEHGPASLLVIGVGVVLGAGLFAFLQSGLGLGGLVGGDIAVGLPVEPVQIAFIFAGVGGTVALAVALETAAESIIKPAAALRRGMD
jgi:putative ABC transport system permease protein